MTGTTKVEVKRVNGRCMECGRTFDENELSWHLCIDTRFMLSNLSWCSDCGIEVTKQMGSAKDAYYARTGFTTNG